MTQDALFHEDVYDALRSAIARLGGYKVVGHRFWPHKSPDKAGELLASCLNRDRHEKLDPEQVILLLRWAREIGFHAAKHWIDAESGYAAGAPVEPEDRLGELLAALNRSREESARAAAALDRTIEQMQSRIAQARRR